MVSAWSAEVLERGNGDKEVSVWRSPEESINQINAEYLEIYKAVDGDRRFYALLKYLDSL